MIELVLVRHGQSVWNLENRFTGWTDVDLSEQGVKEAHDAGKLLKRHGYSFDVAYTSALKRAQKTLDFILEELNQKDIPIHRSDRLNERHYGGLQGLNKKETAEKFSPEQVHIWRRSYDVPPLASNNPKEGEPNGESLKDTYFRVMPYYEKMIEKDLKAGKKIIIAAHGNSLRALAKFLLDISDDKIVAFEIPTGAPLVIKLDENLKSLGYYYLKD